jgi:hypothetical protein
MDSSRNTKLRDRNQLIRIADNSAGGRETVREYESSGYADNEEEEKRIRQAEGFKFNNGFFPELFS